MEIRDSVGHTLRFQYDARGRLAQIVDSAGRLLEVISDSAGRIAAITAPHPDLPDQRVYVARYEYDGWGNLVTVYDALGQTSTFAYNHHLLAKETDRRGFSFYFSYDAAEGERRPKRPDEFIAGLARRQKMEPRDLFRKHRLAMPSWPLTR